MFRPTRSRRVSSTTLALALALILAWAPASPTFASVRATDQVADTPYGELAVPTQAMPDVELAAGALVAQDGRTVWSRNENERRAMASITKVMTAIVVLERAKATDIVTVPSLSSTVGESSAGLKKGEQLTVARLLEGLLIKSGNDAAVALATHVAGGVEPFVALMNEQAAALGMVDTHFTNPHGLDQEGHYTTAHDIAIMARYAMANPAFRQVVGQQYYIHEVNGSSQQYQSTNILLFSYRGANGVKTGWTDDAGYCVVGSAERDGVELYAVVLGTGSEMQRFTDAKELLDFGFAHYRPLELSVKGTVVGSAPITDYLNRSVPAAIAQTHNQLVLDLAGDITKTYEISRVSAPISVGDKVGTARYVQGGRLIATVPIVATEDVAKPFILLRPFYALAKWWRATFGSSS